MARAERSAGVNWQGDLPSGKGTLALESSGAASDLQVDFTARSETPNGKTSPEELIAAAHATCYAMALSNVLSEGGNVPDELDVSGTAALDLDSLKITTVVLDVRGRVPGLDDSGFPEANRQAEQLCPVSNALRGNVEITVNATLEG